MRRRTTIEDVARKAGVSKVTVSYVLNGRADSARISQQTVERVLESARELHYTPNALARMLLGKTADTIAVVFQFAEYFASASSFSSEVMRGVCSACVSLELDLLLHTKPVCPGHAEADALMGGRVDGLLLLRDSDDPTVQILLERRFPTVMFFSRTNRLEVPFVDADNFSGGRLATQHLLELGHTRIGMVKGSDRSPASQERFSGYRTAMESAGLEVDPRFVFSMNSPSDSPASLLEGLRVLDRPTALFVWSDDVAFSVMRWLNEHCLSVPNDISIVGFDSSEACERYVPALTSVRQPVSQMADEATRMLAKVIRKEPIDRMHVLFYPQLDVRASTAPL